MSDQPSAISSQPSGLVTSHTSLVTLLAALEATATAAVDRPELHCQIAMADVYKAAGLLPADLAIPAGARDWSRSQGKSLMLPWLDACPNFERIAADKTGVAALAVAKPGDLLCFNLAHAPHHVAILLAGGRLVHVYSQLGIKIGPCVPMPWAQRLAAVYRPKALS